MKKERVLTIIITVLILLNITAVALVAMKKRQISIIIRTDDGGIVNDSDINSIEYYNMDSQSTVNDILEEPKGTEDSIETDLFESAYAIAGESEDSDKPSILADSDVILIGDKIPLRFYDGSLVYSISDDLVYECEPAIASISVDDSGYRTYLKAENEGYTTVIGKKGEVETQKEFFLLNPENASSDVYSDVDRIVLNVDAEKNGTGSFGLMVAGFNLSDLEIRAYTTGDVWVKLSARWEEGILQVSVSNYLSPGNEGEIVVVFTKKGNPMQLVGFKRIKLEIDYSDMSSG